MFEGELNATQKWWAAFMGDRAFARARAAGKNVTEAGHARAKAKSSQVKVYSSRRQKSHMQRQWARLARRGWCAGVVPTAPRSLERIRREMRQAEPPARGGAARASLGL